MKPDNTATPLRPGNGTVRLEREGLSRIDRIVASAREVPWGLTALQLLWTAGPVTFLALQGGHLLGFGRPAPVQNVVYFGVYTLILGLIGLFARFSANLIRGRKQAEARLNLTRVIDLLPDLIFGVRDLALAALPEPNRRREAASILLRKSDLGPDSIGLAVEELTEDAELARTARQIEIYRRMGMHSRVADLVAQSSERRAAALEALHASAPEAADILRERLSGRAPSQDKGVPRSDGFIDRILSAADRDDPSLMTLADAEDLLVLTLELMSGREIGSLTFEYQGDWRLARTLDEVERMRNSYRLAQAAALSQLRALAARLVEMEEAPVTEDALRLPAAELQQHCQMALRSMLISLRQAGGERKQRRARLKQPLVFIKRLRRAEAQLHEAHERYERALRRWSALRDKVGRREPKNARLRIQEHRVRLNDEQKLRVSAALVAYLDEAGIHSEDQRLFCGSRPLREEDAKQLATELVLILEPILGIGDAGVQMAITSSNAAYFHGLEPGFSADAKAGIAAAVVKEVKQDAGRAAEHLALRLTRVYGVPLSPEMRGFLCDQYGANPERLEIIAAAPLPETLPAESSAKPLLPNRAKEWRQLVSGTEQLIESRR